METKAMEEVWPTELGGAPYGLSVIAVSAVIFYVLSLISKLLTPSGLGKKTSWKWKNITVSFVHSLLSGTWACLCFYVKPEMAEDLISTYDTFAHTLISVSVGYFIYDMWDMFVYQRNRQSYELMGHHVVILICFTIAIVTRIYVGYSVVALLIEINSIFLHLRQLMLICGISKNNSCYRFNSVVNLGTFIVCRISVMAWMSRWMLINKDRIPLVFYTIGSLGLAVMTVMNIILFYRLLQSDFLHKKDKCKQED
ncbi:TLC domain-containing protein 2-like [Argopecten irradians]|uniref:TLC domain-containing protein 2-like n=1 Tax=Argopecten irradians TaxID=31199 RepID=UPI00371E25F6